MFFNRRRVFLAAALLAAGCRDKAPGPAPRYAILKFENLTGDPSLDWVGRAAGEVLSATLARAMDGPVIAAAAVQRSGAALGARPPAAPGVSSQRMGGMLAGASHLITGYITGANGHLVLTASDENVADGKTVQSWSASGATPAAAIDKLAHQLSPRPAPYYTSNADALRLYNSAFELPTADALPSIEQAVQADPNYGPAWHTLANLRAARGDRDGALAAIASGLGHKIDPLSAAELELEKATLANDQPARLEALRRVVSLSPGDTALLRTVAETESATGKFAESAENWKKLTDILPTDTNAWNQLGYARAWAGDYPGALAALARYNQIQPNDPNGYDSTGDIHYMYRKFAEADKAYRQSIAHDKEFERGASVYKDAWAKFQLHDIAGADKTYEEFAAVREKTKSPNQTLLRADWLYRTGRKTDAIALLRKQTSGEMPTSGELSDGEKAVLLGQLAVWELAAGDRTAAARDAERAGRPTTAPAVLIRFVTLPSALPSEWESRAKQMIPGANLASLRDVALAYALLLDGKKAASVPVWTRVSETASPTDFPMRAAAARMRGVEPKLAVVPNPSNINHFAGLFEEK